MTTPSPQSTARRSTSTTLRGTTTLIANVASSCGLTPQYAALQQLQDRFGPRGFTVLGVPCNQFGGQEPGTECEIATFCSSSYAVTFPLTAKTDVNGARRHPLFRFLTAAEDASGAAGDVLWNFEKFVVDANGAVVERFRPFTTPDAPEVVEAIERALAAAEVTRVGRGLAGRREAG